MIETNKAKAAFNDYFQMGDGRSLEKLFQLYRSKPKNEVPTQRKATIAKWSSAHNWQERVEAKKAEIAKAQFEEIKRLAKETGYAIDAKRIWDLNKLAELLFEEIFEDDKRWLPDVKSIGSGEYAERVDLVRFNASLIKEFRAALDDLAKEMGERSTGVRLESDEARPMTVKVVRGVSVDDL